MLDVIASCPFFLGVLLGKVDKTTAKERLFSFLKRMRGIEKLVALFWDQHMGSIHNWYLNQKKSDDLVISASPDFLVREATRRLGVSLIASKVDPCTGRFTGKNCYGSEKVIRLREESPDTEIREFYSDSRSDLPLAEIAESAFLVSGEKIQPFFHQ